MVSHCLFGTPELGKPWNVPKGGKPDMRTSNKDKRETDVADSAPDEMAGVEDGSTLVPALQFPKAFF